MLEPGFRGGACSLALVSAMVAAAGCGEAFSTPGSTATGGATGTGGAGPTSSATDSTAESASSSGPGTGGGGGSTADCSTTGCQQGMYCNEETLICTGCNDLSRFEFAPGVPLLDEPGQAQVEPRVVARAGVWRMVYTSISGSYEIAASDEPFTTGALVPGTGINSVAEEFGPLLLPPDTPLAGIALAPSDAGFLVFSRQVGDDIEIRIADGIDGALSTTFPGVLNSGVSDFHPAIAYKPATQRAWWTQTRLVGQELVTGLVTAPLGNVGVSAALVPLPLENGCHARTPDVAPWVTPDGSLLLFHAEYQDQANCDLNIDGVHVFWTTLDPAGQIPQGGEAKEILGLGAVQPVAPSLSPDMCTLYYSDLDQPNIYAARRR
jgi:hypothetical protein